MKSKQEFTITTFKIVEITTSFDELHGYTCIISFGC